MKRKTQTRAVSPSAPGPTATTPVMFEFFPGIYPWNLAIHLALNMGGVLSEIESVTAPLRHFKSAAEPGAWTAWMSAWREIGDRVSALAEKDAAEGHERTAGKKMLRASLYYFMAERMMRVGDPGRGDIYRKGLNRFRTAMDWLNEGVECVEIPYGKASLPAYFVPPKVAPLGGAPAPCMVFFDGFDVNKEILYYRAIREELVERGVAMLLVDHPGVGESLRFRGLHSIPEMERAGTAVMDYLVTRKDIDPKRVGIMGVSLGGYYAPRAAAFEKRFACCVAWGASYRFNENIVLAMQNDRKVASVTDMLEQARWVFGAEDNEGLKRLTRQITLEGVADKITCPLLITHGENDRQVPVSEAIETYEKAMNSPDRKLKIFTRAEGGVEHVNTDNPGVAIDYMADWIVEKLKHRRTP
ncbi:MAG: alpha/beta fold hydrolase [Thermodesulfobacteriota bacterium]